MQRRQLLAAGPALLAGCVSGAPSDHVNPHAKNYTAPDDVHVYDDPREIPNPPATLSVEAAREYVETYETARMHNELIGESVREDNEGQVTTGGERDVISLEIDPIEIGRIRTTDHGVYFITSLSGRAEHWCSTAESDTHDCSSRVGRNAHAVVHRVDAGVHVRIPRNWYTCDVPETPHALPDDGNDDAADSSGAQVGIYNASGEDRAVDVTIRAVDGPEDQVVYTGSVSMPPHLLVVDDVTRAGGRFEVDVTVDGEVSETFDWELPTGGGTAWTNYAIFVPPAGAPWDRTIAPDADIDIDIPPARCGDRTDETQ